ncbi:MAG: DUF1549 domain-containing protein [Pirellulales bacterium]
MRTFRAIVAVTAAILYGGDQAFAAAPSADGKPAESAKPAAEHTAFFEQKVRPLLVAKCYECHSQDSKILQGGLLLDSRPGWQKGGDSGEAIVPGKPDESLLIRAVKYLKDEYVHMPPKGKMNDDEIAVLVEWVRLGAPDPRSEAKPNKHERVIDVAAGKKHWAFAPLANPQPPTVNTEDWCRTSIDRFIQAKLEAAKLRANPSADLRTLVRRAYFDIVGLPPTPEQIDEVLNDSSPDAYDKLLDRLLASPHYGERWGRHWLDLARFAESHGFEQDYDRPNAYHYRDFVIRALNDDLPYDKFVKWQIAGDEYEPENPQALMATGFLAAGVHATQITANQAEKERYDELDDIGRTIGTTMLGLTIGCARCHDHKYDPVTQADYFRIVSTFTKTVRSDFDVQLDPVGFRKALAEFEPQRTKLAAAVAEHERKVVGPAMEKWLKDSPKTAVAADWVVVKPAKVTAPAVVTFDIQDDGTVQSRGNQFFTLTYTVSLETDLRNVGALRIEALRDESLPHGGPGMAADGGFRLSKIKVAAAPKKGKAEATDLKIVRRMTDVVETKTPVSWAIDAKSAGRDQRAVFELEKPIDFDGGAKLTITLEFSGNYQGIGRFRIALASGKTPSLEAPSVSEAALAVLRTLQKEPAHKLSTAENDALFAWYRARWRLEEAERRPCGVRC